MSSRAFGVPSPGSLVRKGDLVLNVKDYGAVGDGSTDDTATFVAAFTAAAAAAQDLLIPPGTYKLTAGITWDAVTHSVIGGGDAILDFTGMASGTAITVIGQNGRSSAFGFLQVLHRFEGIKVVLPDSDATTVDGFSIADTGNGSNVNFERVFVYGGRDQVVFGDNTWLIRFDKCAFGHAHRRCINAQSVTNAGENYSFYGCVFYSSANAGGTATAVYNDKAGNSDLYFFGCSFDYNDIEIDHQAGHITLSGCHLEDHGTGPMIKLSYTPGFEYTTLTMSGGSVGPTEANPGRDHLIEFVSGDSIRLQLEGVKFTTWNQKTDITKVISGNPTMVFNGGDVGVGTAPNIARPGQLVNLLSNSDFEMGSFQGWWAQGTVTYTVQTTTKNAGTYAAKIAGTGAVGTTALRQIIPCPPNSPVIFCAEMASDTMVSGSTIPRIQWLSGDMQVISTTTFTGVTGNQAFTRMGGKATSPAGTQFASVQIYSTDLNGNVYADDVYFAVLRGGVAGAGWVTGTSAGQVAAGNDSRIVNAAKTVDIQSFTTPGTFTWTKPAGAKMVDVTVIGGGGGGGSGRRGAAATVRCGGGGGGGGGYARALLNAADLPASCSLIVGIGGGGGSSFAVNDNNDGQVGGGGGTSVFNDTTTAGDTAQRVKAAGGAGGAGGTATNGTGGVANFSPVSGGAGGSASGSGGVGNNGSDPAGGGAGGGSGGGITSGDVAGNGGGGGVNALLDQNRSTAGTTPGGAGGTGRSGLSTLPGNGGGGGAASTTGAAGRGGDGGSYGGGGGGGGASLNGNSCGGGGNGGGGAVFVITYF